MDVTWIGIVLVALFPTIVDVLINVGGGSAGIGTFLGMALVFLFFLVYRMYVRIEVLEQKLTLTIQEMALGKDWKSRGEDERAAGRERSD